MSDTDQLKGTPFDDRPGIKVIPANLKVITLLSIIGCSILFILIIVNVFTAKTGLESLEKVQGSDQLEKLPDFAKKFYSDDAIALARARYENLLPITIIESVGVILCFIGAIQMRSLQKQGYFLWIIGNILPLVGGLLFIGMASLKGFGVLFFLGVEALFFILYTMRLKYLK